MRYRITLATVVMLATVAAAPAAAHASDRPACAQTKPLPEVGPDGDPWTRVDATCYALDTRGLLHMVVDWRAGALTIDDLRWALGVWRDDCRQIVRVGNATRSVSAVGDCPPTTDAY